MSGTPHEDAEEPLLGGFTNAGFVTRVGDTVRRPWRPTSPATKALLDHLEREGFDGAPRFLGADDQGREMLSFIPGEAANEPFPAWAVTDEALVGVAELLRRYHDAVASFDPTGYAWPVPVPEGFSGGIVSHNDPNVDNVVFDGGRPVALIDFDLACPGSATWDVACAARLWAPLRDEADMPEQVRGRGLERLAMFVDAYGLPRSERGAGGRRGPPRARVVLRRRPRGGRARARAVLADVERGRRVAGRADAPLARLARRADARGVVRSRTLTARVILVTFCT